ncbi:MAG: tRNA preQ1(34) S-adenosylmethionine ribosyltransferase-isomerase QueA [Chloroflexota bacterium]
MKTIDFNYDLSPKYISQTPIEPRDHSRLLVFNRSDNQILHRHFYELDQILNPGDLLVLNKTRVIPARLFAHKKTGGRVELLLLRHEKNDIWQALVGGKGLNQGKILQVDDGPKCEIIAVLDGSQRLIQFDSPIEPFFPIIGQIPLPPYIHETLEDPERYQTVFAKEPGSAAAPTAGLHFTEELIKRLSERNILITEVTLHVGLDTFAPVTEDDPVDHLIHEEWCEVSLEACNKINETREKGGRIVAVGTTSVRTLESAALNSKLTGRDSLLTPFSGNTGLFILPGYDFKIVEAMITNFHLPKSTLIMLVSAFAGKDLIFNVYEIAKRENYRFFSFGDAMLII